MLSEPADQSRSCQKEIGKPMVSQMIAVVTFAGCVWLVVQRGITISITSLSKAERYFTYI